MVESTGAVFDVSSNRGAPSDGKHWPQSLSLPLKNRLSAGLCASHPRLLDV